MTDSSDAINIRKFTAHWTTDLSQTRYITYLEMYDSLWLCHTHVSRLEDWPLKWLGENYDSDLKFVTIYASDSISMLLTSLEYLWMCKKTTYVVDQNSSPKSRLPFQTILWIVEVSVCKYVLAFKIFEKCKKGVSLAYTFLLFKSIFRTWLSNNSKIQIPDYIM